MLQSFLCEADFCAVAFFKKCCLYSGMCPDISEGLKMVREDLLLLGQ